MRDVDVGGVRGVPDAADALPGGAGAEPGGQLLLDRVLDVVGQLVAARGGTELMPELGYAPTNRYLPPRANTGRGPKVAAPALESVGDAGGFFGWVDRVLSR